MKVFVIFCFAINTILFVMRPCQLLDRAAAGMHSAIWQEIAAHVHDPCPCQLWVIEHSTTGISEGLPMHFLPKSASKQVDLEQAD